jgi:hypothetical protein
MKPGTWVMMSINLILITTLCLYAKHQALTTKWINAGKRPLELQSPLLAKGKCNKGVRNTSHDPISNHDQ